PKRQVARGSRAWTLRRSGLDGKGRHAGLEAQALILKKKTWKGGELVTFHSKDGSRTLDYARRHRRSRSPSAMVHRSSNRVSPKSFAYLAFALLASACGGQSDFADVAAPEEEPDAGHGGSLSVTPGQNCGPSGEFACDGGAPPPSGGQ